MELFKACAQSKPQAAFLVFFISNRYCTPKMFYYKNLCSKQVGGYFLVYSSFTSIVCLMLFYEKCMFKARRKLLSVYSATFLMQKM